MKTTNRREFLKNAAISSTAAGLAVSGLSTRRIYSQEKSGSHTLAYRNLGSTGYKVTEVGFGAMNTRDAELITAAIDAGLNYLDTANGYMNGVNEEIIGNIMKTRRDKVFLTTKINSRNMEDMPNMIGTSLKRLQTDHVDLLLLHGASSRDQLFNEDIRKVFDTAQKKGYTRFIGVSTHSNHAAVLDAATESKFWNAVLVGHNYSSPPNVKQSIEKARKAGIAIIAMKTLLKGNGYPGHKMGNITNNQAALRWVLDDMNVDTTIPGMTSFEQLQENLPVMGMKTSLHDSQEPYRIGQNLNGLYCSGVAGCTGCLHQCPKGVEVSDINRCVGYAYGYGNLDLAYENYRELPRSSRIDICSDCDECVVKCINGLNLTENIKKARSLFA